MRRWKWLAKFKHESFMFDFGQSSSSSHDETAKMICQNRTWYYEDDWPKLSMRRWRWLAKIEHENDGWRNIIHRIYPVTHGTVSSKTYCCPQLDRMSSPRRWRRLRLDGVSSFCFDTRWQSMVIELTLLTMIVSVRLHDGVLTKKTTTNMIPRMPPWRE